jgi:hypothetical protein
VAGSLSDDNPTEDQFFRTLLPQPTDRTRHQYAMYKCQLPHPKDDKLVQVKGQRLTEQRALVQDVGMTKMMTMEMMMTSMIQRMTKTSSQVPN